MVGCSCIGCKIKSSRIKNGFEDPINFHLELLFENHLIHGTLRPHIPFPCQEKSCCQNGEEYCSGNIVKMISLCR